jgi:DNA invertase Pin-like site-specific DNA recombinase
MPPRRRAPARMIAYVRVSTDEQADSGLGLESQIRQVTSECERREWRMVRLIRDEGKSAKTLARPGLQEALQAIADGKADGIVAAKLDRLSRSVIDFARLLDWAFDLDVTIVALDLQVDTSTAGGRLVANVISAVAEWERAVIAERTAAGMAVKRSQGNAISRPAVADNPELLARIQAGVAGGMTFQEIANDLNRDGVPTLRGGKKWRPSSVSNAAGSKRRSTRPEQVDLPQPKRRKR